MIVSLIDLMKENGFTLKKAKSRWYPSETITDTDYADDLALLVNNLPKPNPCCVAWSKLQDVLASKGAQIKQSSYVLNKRESSPL